MRSTTRLGDARDLECDEEEDADDAQRDDRPSDREPRQEQEEDDDRCGEPDAPGPRQDDARHAQKSDNEAARHDPAPVEHLVEAEDERGQEERGELGRVLARDRRDAPVRGHPADEIHGDPDRRRRRGRDRVGPQEWGARPSGRG